ncbi:MAG TPA: hypothetical protein PLG54_07700, partial [Bacteroidales bacterium]|nr:hypothetical protein [Bacteroidales bacterium]HOH91462.1 hypothetical protein [Bacteroidales bacterium]HOR05379.1 hypothetical protein [Bacteroidales bacterium]HOU35275.1 hypothetical protein [Bacteroidales bacterium]HXK64197.1 hypothetical protein [Bacteroidales bacterium]
RWYFCKILICNYRIRSSEFTKSYELQVFNAFGSCIYNRKISRNDYQLNLSNQSSDIYFYRAYDESGTLGTGKLIIRK